MEHIEPVPPESKAAVCVALTHSVVMVRECVYPVYASLTNAGRGRHICCACGPLTARKGLASVCRLAAGVCRGQDAFARQGSDGDTGGARGAS